MFRFDSTYKVRPRVNLADPTFWNERFRDIDLRLNACEAFSVVAKTASDEIINEGIRRIDETLQPAINQAITEVTALSSQVSVLITTISGGQADFTAQMNLLLSQANATVALLNATGTIDGGTF